MFLIVFTSFVLFFYALIYYIKIRRLYKFTDNLPGPKGIPILGVATEFNCLNREEKCNKLLQYAEEFPNIGSCWFGPTMLKLYIHNPDYIQKIYNAPQCLQKPVFYKFFGWGSGLVTADAKTWRVHRKLLNSAFTLKSLQNFIPIFHEGSKEFVRQIGRNLGKGEFNVLEYAVKATLDSICATSFGVNINAQENNHQFNKYLQRSKICHDQLKSYVSKLTDGLQVQNSHEMGRCQMEI
uniref:CSON006017 protein n=1 Tax=Culicoides sonorensis TaxID=179676 RepID=A0A336LJB7_CULSO